MALPPGMREHLRRLQRLSSAEVIRAAGAAVSESADAIRAEAHNSITRGAVSGAGHIPSAPGQPPNEDSGFLRSKVTNVETGPLTAEVRSEAPYASALEFGTSRVAARPYIRPARDKELAPSQRRLARQIDRLIRRSG